MEVSYLFYMSVSLYVAGSACYTATQPLTTRPQQWVELHTSTTLDYTCTSTFGHVHVQVCALPAGSSPCKCTLIR